MLKRILIPILAMIDFVLMAVIVIFPGSSAGNPADSGSPQVHVAQETVSFFPDEEDLSQDIISEGLPEEFYSDTLAAGLPVADEIAGPEPDEISQDDDVSTEFTVLPQESGDAAPGTQDAEPSSVSFSDAVSFDTSERPSAADFTWITPEIIAGTCPAGSVDMDFPEALGGWKCYIWDSEGIERFANMDFAGTVDNIRLTFDWYYTYVGSQGRGYDDNTPDSVYKGSLAGNVEAYGAGKVVLTDFYRMDGHQYAFGTIQWPDGISGHLTLVRP